MSDEVTSFLRSVEQLKDRRDEEDIARSRELEERILQDRRERQLRRADRARSISPQKSSPLNTPPPPSHHRHADSQTSEGLSLASSPALENTGSPRPRSAHRDHSDMMGSNEYSTSPTKENVSPLDLENKRAGATSPSHAMPTRTPTLSWQRRPPSQDRPRSRPLSMVAAENAAARSSTTAGSDQAEQQPASRDQIAQALGSKDPAWFRQTPDRGQGSAAYRKNQVEDEDRLDMSSVRAQLPGMFSPAPTQPDPDATPTRAASPGLRGKLGSPLPLSPAQRLEPPIPQSEPVEDEPTSIDRQLMSPPSGRTSPNRPISPTKGMGGFVQSAMMKRTDSVKRWSVSSPTGLQRADSIASVRPKTPHSPSRPTSMSRESSSRPTSRPTSSHADAAPLALDTTKEPAIAEEPSHATDDDSKLPVSPSRTMDPRRWSPTKSSSWLESALNKPESPKAKPTPPSNSQPSWMADLNKAKAQKASGQDFDLGRTSSVARSFEVKTGGLLRSSPMGMNVKSPASRGLHSPSPSLGGERPGLAALRGTLSASSSADDVNAGRETPEKTSATSSPSTRQKPETPPKKDFRANLKTRPVPAGGDAPQQAEFQNVFGSLRRTKTQNYVAPDTLKNNILRGKAGLAVTDGPKPSERKDEFKDAILAKKAGFNQAKAEGKGVKPNSSASAEKPIPEGLAKRLEMNKTGSKPALKGSTSPHIGNEEPARTFSPGRSNTMSPVTRRDSVDVTQSPASGTTSSHVPTLHKETSAPARLQKPGGGGLADRFNPALAGFLARGPPPMASNKDKDDSGSNSAPSSAQTEAPTAPGPQLTHMTKNRARGPKRKAPTSTTKAEPAPSATRSDSVTSDQLATSSFEPKVTEAKPPAPKLDISKPAVLPEPVTKDAFPLVEPSRKPSQEQPTPLSSPVPLASPTFKGRPRSPTKIHEQVAALAAKSQQPTSGHSRDHSTDLTSPAASPRKLDVKRISKFLDESTPKPEAPRPLSPSKTGGNRPLPEPRPLSPQKTGGRALPESPRKEAPVEKVDSEPVVSVRSGAAIFGGSPATQKPKPSPISPLPKNINLRSPPSNGSARPLPTPGPTSPPMTSPSRSPSKHAADVSALFNDFFGPARPQRQYTVDAAEVLVSRPAPPPKVRTQQMQLFRIAGDGKKQPVQASYERVLFEREMYICAHSYTSADTGRGAAEVYFWVGDDVPPATADDAAAFAAREARAAGGQLVRLQQGKESPEFLQALGGIVIVRRGSSTRYDSLAPEMLCGRRYLGQIAFDEVDFDPASLCSGFAYLVTKQGQCHLWKGKGSDVDELGCARLVGMELALMGELTEVEDGSEPDAFWGLFEGGAGAAVSRVGSADHWRLKPNYDKYSGRLFCADAGSRQQITELHPFSQADLLPSGIYILDAFFELYVVVGRAAQRGYASFRLALDFAQEYAILAAGAEDRPFVPVATVVLEGIPRDLKSVFRKWSDAQSPTRTTAGAGAGAGAGGPGTLRRGRSLRVVPLTQALQALTG